MRQPDRAHIALYDAWQEAMRGAPGPTFIDVPLDVLVSAVDEAAVEWPELDQSAPAADADAVAAAARVIDGAERPVIMAGTGTYWHHGEGPLRELAEKVCIPVFMNGLGRGLLPADHPNAGSRSRGAGLGGADVLILVGTRLDFRLNFGQSPPLASDVKLVRIDALESDLNRNRPGDADQLVVALGGHGEYVTDPAAVGPAIDRAFASGLPALVNIACDPAVAYPRSTNLA